MQALTIFGAIAGSISAASEIVKALDKPVSTAWKVRDAPEQAISTLRDVRMMRVNMLRFQQLLDSHDDLRERGMYIPLDDTQNTFIDCITSLDELESLVKPLSDPTLQPLDLVDRLEWVMKDKRIELLSKRVHDAQSSLGLMLTILSNESLVEVQKALAGLSGLTQRIGENVAHLSRRSLDPRSYLPSIMDSGDDEDEKSTIRPRFSHATLLPRPDSVILPSTIPEEPLEMMDQDQAVKFVAHFAFEAVLKSSLAYRRAPEWDLEDVSFRSSIMNPHAWSLFSKLSSLSLGDISTISVIALPLCPSDLLNSEHYHFGTGAESSSSVETIKNPQTGRRDADFQDPVSTRHLPRLVTHPPPPISPPQSPSTGPRAGMTRVLHTLKKALDPGKRVVEPSLEAVGMGIVESKDVLEISFSKSPPSPSNSHTLNFPAEDARSIRSQNSFHYLEQLSNLQLDENKLYLLHSDGEGLPCKKLIDPFREDKDIETRMSNGQLSLAASHGYLDSFRCEKCSLSLANIAKREKSGEPRFEIWCGASGCLDESGLLVCPCFVKIRQMALPTDQFFGCRMLLENCVRCPRCFTRCPDCLTEATGCVEGCEIFSLQEGLLMAQKWLFKNVTENPEIQSKEKILNYRVAQLEIRLQLLPVQNETTERLRNLLVTRQRILNWKKGIIPTWREMNQLKDKGRDFWNGPVQNMRDMIEESDEYLKRISDENSGSIPGLNNFTFQEPTPESDTYFFDKLQSSLPGLAI